MKSKKIIYILALVLISASGFAQQNAQFNQYIFNELVINPAYAGTKELLNINAIYSKQWAGLDGAPSTQTISVEGPAFKSQGVGFHVVNDKIGVLGQQGFFGSFSHKIQLNEKFKLSFGLAAGASNFSVDGTKMTTATPDDPNVVPLTKVNKLKFDSKFGMFLYSQRAYAGFSVSDLTASLSKESEIFAKPMTHYYLTAGYVLDVVPGLKWKPSFLIKYASKAPTNIDLNTFFLINEQFWIGASVRFGSKIVGSKNLEGTLKNKDAVALMLDYNVNPRFRIGYAYVITTSALKNYGGHEVSLGYYFPSKASITKMKTIRYF